MITKELEQELLEEGKAQLESGADSSFVEKLVFHRAKVIEGVELTLDEVSVLMGKIYASL